MAQTAHTANAAQTFEFEVLGQGMPQVFTETLGAHAGMVAWSRMVDRVSVRLFGSARGVRVDAHADGEVLTFTKDGDTVTVTQRRVEVL